METPSFFVRSLHVSTFSPSSLHPTKPYVRVVFRWYTISHRPSLPLSGPRPIVLLSDKSLEHPTTEALRCVTSLASLMLREPHPTAGQCKSGPKSGTASLERAEEYISVSVRVL